MGELSDVLGEEFEKKYEQKREQRREQARKVPKEDLMEICYKAIRGGGFDGEEPRFRFDAGEVDHDVLLMESPEDDMQKFRHELGEDAMSLGMFHLDQLFSCAFQEHMLGLLDKIEEDTYYVVVGRYQEKTQTDGSGSGKTYYNVNPVRGIVPLNVAEQYAKEYESHMEGSSIEEQAQEQSSSSTDDSSNSNDVDIGGLDEDDEASKEDILNVFQAVGNEAPQVLEAVTDGDSDAIETLVETTNENVDGEAEEDRILDVFEEEVEEIEGRGEEEEDDGGIDIGGLGGDDEEESEDETSVSDQPEDSGGDGDSDVEDWF